MYLQAHAPLSNVQTYFHGAVKRLRRGGCPVSLLLFWLLIVKMTAMPRNTHAGVVSGVNRQWHWGSASTGEQHEVHHANRQWHRYAGVDSEL